MRAIWVVAIFVGLGTSFSGGQQASSSAQPQQPDTEPSRVKVYTVGPGVTAPELLPANTAPIPDEKCKKKNEVHGRVVLSVLVDATGKPRNLMFLHPTGTDLDKFALQTVATDRFNPGSYDGAPAVVAQSVEVNMQACVEEKKDEAGRKNYFLRLTSQPEQKFGALPQPPDDAVLASVTLSPNDFSSGSTRIERVGRGVSAPVLLNFVAAEFSDKARKAKYQGVCVLSLIVDAQGLPQNVRVIRDLGMGLDEKAIEAVNQYRFKPAMKSGAPVPVMINVEVNFKLY